MLVGRIELAPGEYRTYAVERANILVIRRDGNLNAFHNVCRHRGALLCEQPHGAVENDCITCPYHAWSYSACGRLLAAANMTDAEGWNRDEHGLRPIACEEWNGYVFVNLDAQAVPFTTAYAAVSDKFDAWGMDALKVGHTLVYEVHANWKLIFQNYSECYHCPTVHPALNRLSPYKSAGNDLLEGAFLGGPMLLSDGVETMSTNGKAVAAPLPALGAAQRRIVCYYTIFPTMFISPHPDYVLVHRLQRLATDRTQVVCELLFHPQGNADPARAVKFWDQTNRQDWHVCQLVQQGAASVGYEAGPYSPLERVLPRFDEHYRSVMDRG